MMFTRIAEALEHLEVMERESITSFAQQVSVMAEFHRLKTGLGRVDQDELILSDGGGR
jgi:hypothetical protein